MATSAWRRSSSLLLPDVARAAAFASGAFHCPGDYRQIVLDNAGFLHVFHNQQQDRSW